MTSRRIVVLVSGNGTNLQALMDAVGTGELNAEIVAVISNKAEAFGLERAARAGIRTEVLEALPDEERGDYDARLASLIAPYRPGLVVLAGWMRLFTTGFCTKHRIINLHPAKPGLFPGLHAIQRSYDAWKAGELNESGVMVHWVPDSSVDAGPVIVWRPVPFLPGDSIDDFEARVHAIEHEVLLEATAQALDSVQTTARRQTIDLAAEDASPPTIPARTETQEVRNVPLK